MMLTESTGTKRLEQDVRRHQKRTGLRMFTAAVAASCAGLLTVALGASAWGEDKEAQPRTENRAAANAAQHPAQHAGMVHGGMVNDHLLVQWLLTGNHGEIMLAEFAQGRAQQESVKDFASMMIKDHTAFINKLEKVDGAGQARTTGTSAAPPATTTGTTGTTNPPAATAPKAGTATAPKTGTAPARTGTERTATERTATERGTSDRTGNERTASERGTAAREPGQATSVIELKRELGQACIESKKKELSKREGADFDHAYMHCQVAMHEEMLDTLKVFRRHASPELQAVIDEGLKTTQTHLDRAWELARGSEKNGK